MILNNLRKKTEKNPLKKKNIIFFLWKLTNCSKKKFFTSTNIFRGTMSSVMKLIYIFCIPSLLLRLMFESFKQASMAIVSKDICRKKLVLFLEKDISPGWWDKEVDKITCKIVSELIKFSFEVKDTQKIYVKRTLFALDDRILLKKETKIFNIKKSW